MVGNVVPVDHNDTYLAARSLQLAGRWELALRHAPEGRAGAALRAEIVTDRHLWRLDPVDEAVAAVGEITQDRPDLAAYLSAQLEYLRRLLARGDQALAGDPVDTFANLDGGPLHGWAEFWHAVALENLRGDTAGAAAGYARARSFAEADGDLLLESYAVRHLAGLALEEGDPGRAIPLARRSLHLRAACGARPHVAAAQAMLADALGESAEAAELRAIVAVTATELGLTWLLPNR
jgi:hypothetical protein